MYLKVRVIPRAKKSEVIELGDNVLRVKVTAPPVGGRANEELIEVLARHYGTARSSVTIKRGATSRNKVILIEDRSNR